PVARDILDLRRANQVVKQERQIDQPSQVEHALSLQTPVEIVDSRLHNAVKAFIVGENIEQIDRAHVPIGMRLAEDCHQSARRRTVARSGVKIDDGKASHGISLMEADSQLAQTISSMPNSSI